MPKYLPEVLEREATGTVAQIYADIRTVLAVPIVNLVYRHLAVEPGRLDSVWTTLRPNLAHPGTQTLAAELARNADRARPPVVPLELQDFARSGVSTGDLSRARATLSVYERANGLNLLAMNALLRGTPGREETVRRVAPDRVRVDKILRMADLSSLGRQEQEILEKLGAAVAPAGDEALVPTLYRHLAARPRLLALILARVGHSLCASELGAAAVTVTNRATTLASRLPFRVDAVADPDVRSVLERFALIMASMLVAGRTITAALKNGGPLLVRYDGTPTPSDDVDREQGCV